jgi:hypothetical protein
MLNFGEKSLQKKHFYRKLIIDFVVTFDHLSYLFLKNSIYFVIICFITKN